MVAVFRDDEIPKAVATTTSTLAQAPSTQQWEGRIDGNVIPFGGIREEDDGTTSAAFTLEVDFEIMSMTGKEEWAWEGPGGTCPDSQSIVTATRREP